MNGVSELSGNISVTVWFDYSCPHSHRGLGWLDTLSGELPLAIDRRPYLLRPDAPLNTLLTQDRAIETRSPSQIESGRRPPLAPLGAQPVAEPFSSRSLSTVLVHEATAFAKDQGMDRDYYLEVAGEYWQKGSDLGSIYTLRRAATKIGLDWGTMWPTLESGHYRPWVMEEHWAAVERGVKGAPAYLIGGKMYTGAVGLDDMRAALESAGSDR
ncbi:MAG: hypothetical protein CMJ45_00765 [Planctomyces sp.]|nr:hypothetical protein [Planctomyces sp.]